MAQKITDLSDLLSEDKHVRLSKNGRVYVLPGDLPAELYLRIQQEAIRQQQALEKGEPVDLVGATRDLFDHILQLFRYGDPEMSELPPEATLSQLISLIDRVYAQPADQQVQEGGERPSRAGTRSSSTPRRSKSRS